MQLTTRVVDDKDWYKLEMIWEDDKLQSVRLELPRSKGRIGIICHDNEAELLIDALRAEPRDASQYANDAFLLQRNYDRVAAKGGGGFPYHTFNYDLAALKDFEILGSLPPNKFEAMRAELNKHFDQYAPLGHYQDEVKGPSGSNIEDVHAYRKEDKITLLSLIRMYINR